MTVVDPRGTTSTKLKPRPDSARVPKTKSAGMNASGTDSVRSASTTPSPLTETATAPGCAPQIRGAAGSQIIDSS